MNSRHVVLPLQIENAQEDNKEKNTKPHQHSTPVHCWWGREFEKTPPEALFDKKSSYQSQPSTWQGLLALLDQGSQGSSSSCPPW